MESATSFDRCSDIGATHVEQAIASRVSLRAFFDRAAEVSRPEDGGPKVLLACAALVGSDWLDGELRIELEGDENETRLSMLIDAGFRERIFPVIKLRVPFDEFARAIRLAPHLVAPLTSRERAGMLILSPRARAARPSARPTTRMAAVRPDIHTKPTVVRMSAVRLEDHPDARREDHADIDEEWDGEKK